MTSDAQALDELLLLKRTLSLLMKVHALNAAPKISQHPPREPIAIIGMGCRFPGGANDPESFWQLLSTGVDAIREVPPDRWDVDAFYDPLPQPGKMYVHEGGFLSNVDRFDAHFFGITPREAISLDPQQRLLLEVSWEALENAGIAPNKLLETQTGVYIGLMTTDYAQLNTARFEVDPYIGTGTETSFSAGRLSYLLGLQGPSMSIGTACSSSLVTTHLACQALRAHECDIALSGGVNLMLNPQTNIMLCQMKAVAPDGRCKTFEASADGYGRGEGCGVLVLKRLQDALADGDRIWAVIRGSAVNHDGPSGGLTVPNGLAQEKVLRQALKSANVSATAVDYIEAHGTGTSLGDPIEIRALANVCGAERNSPLLVGSVKTNIGHLEAAAGVAGIIKVALSLQYGQIPPHLHLSTPNPHIEWDDLPIKVPTELMKWPRSERIAGVSSFGMSGTNAHVILEEAPVQEVVKADVERPLHLLTLSAKTEGALQELVSRYAAYLAENEEDERCPEPVALRQAQEPGLADVCFTANTGRSHFKHRYAVVAADKAQMAAQLALKARQSSNDFSRSGPPETTKVVTTSTSPQVAFLFTGQGSQYVGMGQELYETEPLFRQIIEQCDEILRPYLSSPLLSVLYSTNPIKATHQPTIYPTHLLNQTAYTQVALFALEYALAKLWESWGIVPFAVMGHSLGELVAACVAGVFSLEDGLKLVAERGRLMQSTSPPELGGIEGGRGEMVAIFASEAEVKSVIDTQAPKECSTACPLGIAAINGPQLTIISGRGLTQIVSHFEKEGVRCQPLTVSHAFHSPLMEPILEPFREIAKQITFKAPRIALISNLTGELVTHELTTPDYWVRHIRQPVRFADGMKTLEQMGIGTFIEIGPKANLLGMGRRCHPSTSSGLWLPSLRPRSTLSPSNEWRTLMTSIAQLYVHGHEIDWMGFHNPPRRKVVLPTYPFQRERYWFESLPSQIKSNTKPEQPSQHLADQTPVASNLLDKFNNASDNERPKLLKDYLAEQIAQILYLPASRLDVDSPINYMGLDSLMAVELRNRIRNELGIELSVATFLEGVSLSSLAAQLIELMEQMATSGDNRGDADVIPSSTNQEREWVEMSI